MAVVGIIGMRVLSSRRQDLQAFLASGLRLVGMLTSVAFGIFPNVLPSNSAQDLSLTIHNAATAEHGLIVGLTWFIPGMALAAGYSVFVYRHFVNKVD
jgi:cytochrome d ubiquinol oxidase subunit II